MTNTDQVLTVAPQVRFSVNFPFLEPTNNVFATCRVDVHSSSLCLTRSVFQVYSCVYETKRGTMKNNENVRTETVAIWLQEQEQESNEEQTKPQVLLSVNVAMWLQEEHEQENSEEQAKPQVLLMYW